jgi:isopenicillin-N epimerase
MTSIPLPPCDTGELGQWLYEQHRIVIPVMAWDDRPLMRLSVQGYNTQEDVDTLLGALGAFFNGGG